MRTIIVGDVHGMLAELRALVEKVGLTRDDVFVSVGDLVDKGPDSAGVVRYVRTLRDEGFRVVLVKGNHEDKHERFRRAISVAPDAAGRYSNGAELARITQALAPEDVAFLETAVLYFRIPGRDAVVVHAGVPPDVADLPADASALSRSDYGRLSQLLRVRYVTGSDRVQLLITFDTGAYDAAAVPGEDLTDTQLAEILAHRSRAQLAKRTVRKKGSFVVLGEEEPGDPLWAEVYDGRFGHVYFGHHPFPDRTEPAFYPHATGLDLGCVFGGRLAAAVLEDGSPPSFVTVVSGGKFATSYWDE